MLVTHVIDANVNIIVPNDVFTQITVHLNSSSSNPFVTVPKIQGAPETWS